MAPGVRLTDIGRASYEDVWRRQRQWADAIAGGDEERLVLVEHDDVVTLGRGTKSENVLTRSMPTFEIERGGDATYHGPGQLVGYPLLRLVDRGLGIHSYLRRLEALLVRTIGTFGIRGGAVARKTGVWVEDRKIASIGIAVRGGVSFHGFALNVNTDLSKFEAVNPCGFDASVMTSMENLLGDPVSMDAVKRAVVDSFEDVFGARVLVAPAATT